MIEVLGRRIKSFDGAEEEVEGGGRLPRPYLGREVLLRRHPGGGGGKSEGSRTLLLASSRTLVGNGGTTGIYRSRGAPFSPG